VEQELDAIKAAYVQAYEGGNAPPLQEVVAAHPQYGEELADFILTFIELERVVEWLPETVESSASTRRLRRAAVQHAGGMETLHEAREVIGVSRQRIAEAVNVPVSFLVYVERGRLEVDGGTPVDARFVTRLGAILRRTSEDTLAILRATLWFPTVSQAVHRRNDGEPTASVPPAPQPFRVLIARCDDLTPAQRREWLEEGERQADDASPSR